MKNAHHFNPYTSVSLPLSEINTELLRCVISIDSNLSPRKINKPVVLYGAGNLGRMAKVFFDHLKLPFLYVVDIYADKQRLSSFWNDVKIMNPSEVDKKDKENYLLVVCIVNAPLISLRDKLIKDGWNDVVFFYDVSQAYRDIYPLNNGWFLGDLNERDKNNVEKVFLSLSDDLSRAHYLQFILWRKLRVELLISGVTIDVDNRFFIKEIVSVLRENEVFVDCGAHNGSVTNKFSKIVNDKYKKIYAIEPDKTNAKEFESNTNSMPEVKLIRCALDNKNSQGKFFSDFGFASKLGLGGKDTVKTCTLDSLNIPATFVKMHLEGGELDALKGAILTIRKYRPIVAVTIYHNDLGVSEIPLYLIENLSKYSFYIRLHSWGGTGAVFYAIPQERFIE